MSNNDNLQTIELMSLLKSINDESNLENYLSKTLGKSTDLQLHEYLSKTFKDKGLNKSTVIKNADIDRTYAYEILRGDKKPGRDKILQLCIGGNLSLDESNKALKIGNAGELYAKIPRDSIIIFGINKNLDILDINELLFSYNLPLLGEE